MLALDGDIMLVFGGACHAVNGNGAVDGRDEAGLERDGEDSVAYGDRVVDLADVQLFDLKTHAWLRCESSYAPLRGGVNAMFRCVANWLDV